MKLEADALTFAQVEQAVERLDTLATDDRVDLSAVSHADSAGLALLLELARRSRARGARLKLVDPPAQLRGLVAFFGLDGLIDTGA